MTKETPPNLHKEVVTGVVQVIKCLTQNKGEIRARLTYKSLMDAGCTGKSEEAQMWIFEFIKDGVCNVSLETMTKVGGGDYSGIWKMTNEYLKCFGHAPVEPVPIDA